MRYYKLIQDGNIIAIGTGYGGVEITEDEYLVLLDEIREKASLADLLYNGEIDISDVPVEWQEDIQQKVNERINEETAAEEEEATAEDIAQALEGIL